MIKRLDRLMIGIAIILFTLFAAALVTAYEETTGNRLGYYAIGFVPLLTLGIYIIATAFTKKEW